MGSHRKRGSRRSSKVSKPTLWPSEEERAQMQTLALDIPEVIIDLSEFEEKFTKEWGFSLFGRFLGDGKPKFHKVLKKVRELWKTSEPFSVMGMSKSTYCFKIANKADMEYVFHGGPWVVEGSTLLLIPWEPLFIPEGRSQQFRSSAGVAVWVRFRDLLDEYRERGGVLKLAVYAGNPLYVDISMDPAAVSARALVEVNLKEPLLEVAEVVESSTMAGGSGQNGGEELPTPEDEVVAGEETAAGGN